MDMFYALAEPTRRNILELLAKNESLSATQIYKKFHVSHPAISQHLQILKEAKLVLVEKLAQQRIYRLNPKGMSELEEWTTHMTAEWNTRLNSLDRVLKEESRKSNIKKVGLHGR